MTERPAWLRSDRAAFVSLVAAIAVGVAIRIALCFAADGKSWSDSAVIALMAMHALRGKFYTFYWGQDYMGSLESLGVAPFFAVFGVSDVTLSMGLLPWYVLFAVALQRVARRCAGEVAGAIAPWLLAVAPPYVQYQQIMPRGDYPETLMLGTILLWLVLRVTHDDLTADSERRHLNAIAFVAGLAFWTNWLVFPYFAVAGTYLWLHDRWLPLRPSFVVMIAFFLLGSSPFWIHNIRHGFPTFSFVSGVQTAQSRAIAFDFALRGAIPTLLGFRDLDGRFVYGWLGALLTVGSALGVLALAVGLYRSWWALLRGRVRDSEPIVALLLLVVAMVAIYSVGLPGRFHVPRYLLPIVTATLVLEAAAIAWLTNQSRLLGAVVLSALVVLCGVQIVALGLGFRRSTERPGAIGPVDKLARALLKAGVRFGYADYADATITTYLTRDRVVLADYGGAHYPLDEVDFRDPAVIVRDGAPPAGPTLAMLNAESSSKRVPGYRIHWPVRYDGVPRSPSSRGGWSITASAAADRAADMLDGDPWTYWSVPAETPRPSVTLDLGRVTVVNGVFLDGGERDHDGFVRLRVDASLDGVDWGLVKEAEAGMPLFFERDGQITTVARVRQDVLFPPRPVRFLRLALLEGDGRHAWSIGELGVFGPGPEGTAFIEPEFADPTSPALVERRLRSQALRELDDDRALLELVRLYRSLGEEEKARAIERLEAERFQPRIRLDWRFGGDLKLLGYDWKALDARRLEITYYWQAMRPIDAAYASYLRLSGGGDQQQDDSLLGALHGASGWLPGEIVKDRRTLTVPQPGTYEAKLGVWIPASRRHVRIGRWWGPRTAPFCRIVATDDAIRVDGAS